MNIIVNNICVGAGSGTDTALAVCIKLLAESGIKACEPRLRHRSVDARKKNDIRFVCSVVATVPDDTPEEKIRAAGASVLQDEKLRIEYGTDTLTSRPVVVGSGPCGMFCALLLAESGYAPIVIERGGSVSEREAAISRFRSEHVLSPDTNIEFGAGGAGTFSDGKLLTRINDPLCSYVFSAFNSFGAPESIMTLAKPHIGTDILRVIVDRMLSRICELGGEVRYNTKFESVIYSGGRAAAIVANGDVIPCGALVLALGHSARDSYDYLLRNGFDIVAKDFSCGVRIEHLQEDIDCAMYGENADIKKLGHAEYSLSERRGDRGVYTFCMCPGGEVVAAATEEGGIVTNGMSDFARSGKNANSAIAVSVLKSDFGATPEGAIAFQRSLERAAFTAGGGGYCAPIQTVGDFLSGKAVNSPSTVKPTYMDGNCRVCEMGKLMPEFMTSMLKLGIAAFDRKVRGFAVPYAVLTGFETRTSSPVRIQRNADFTANGFGNIYPAGEGAGYSGGITSSAIDGVKTALAIMKKYAPPA